MLHDDDDSVYLFGLEKATSNVMWAKSNEICVFRQTDVAHVLKFRTVNQQNLVLFFSWKRGEWKRNMIEIDLERIFASFLLEYVMLSGR